MNSKSRIKLGLSCLLMMLAITIYASGAFEKGEIPGKRLKADRGLAGSRPSLPTPDGQKGDGSRWRIV